MVRLIFALAFFAAAALAACALSPRLAALTEARYAAQVEATLRAGGFGWARGEVDGLTVRLTGAAPSTAAHDQALTVVAAVSPLLHVTDVVTAVPKVAPTTIPPQIDILKGETGLILSGVAPNAETLATFGGDQTLVATGSGAFGPDWTATAPLLDDIARTLVHVRISLRQDIGVIDGLAPDQASREAMLANIDQLGALGWKVTAAIDAPPPALTDFSLTASTSPDGTVVTCAAANAADAQRIEHTASTALSTKVKCAIGVGAPSETWADAAVGGLEALAGLPAGDITLSGLTLILTATAPTPPASVTAAAERLRGALPTGYRLAVDNRTLDDAPPPPVAAFALTIDWPGGGSNLTLKTKQGGEGLSRAQASLGAYARALFPGADISFAAETGAPPPLDWRRTARIGLEALSLLDRGALTMTDSALRLSGAASNPAQIRDAHDRLTTAGPTWRAATSITHNPARIAAAQPLPADRCAAAVASALANAPLSFQPASTTLTSTGKATIGAIAALLTRCPDARFEIGGHTDSQGSETSNFALSRNRAEAVLSALIAAKAPPGRLIATGYGETRPIADNATPVGRALNRRIEFTLLEAPK